MSKDEDTPSVPTPTVAEGDETAASLSLRSARTRARSLALAGWPEGMEYVPRVPVLKSDMIAFLRAECSDLLVSSGAPRGRPRSRS